MFYYFAIVKILHETFRALLLHMEHFDIHRMLCTLDFLQHLLITIYFYHFPIVYIQTVQANLDCSS